MIEYSDRISIPEKCKNCPTLKALAANHDSMSQSATDIGQMSVSGELNDQLIDDHMQLTGATREEAEQKITSKQDEIRSATIDMLDELDVARESQVNMGKASMMLCEGELQLKGESGHQRITAYVCMSGLFTQSTEVDDVEIVTVEREDTRFSDDYDA